MKNTLLLMTALVSVTACSTQHLPVVKLPTRLDLPMFTSISPDTPGISSKLSGKTGQRVIDTISFASARSFAQARVVGCITEHIAPPTATRPDAEPRLIQFAGNGRVMAAGTSPLNYRRYGIIPTTDTLAFNLSVAARPSGTSYRFGDVVQTHQGTASPIRLYDRGNQVVYNALQTLFQQLDTCTTGKPRRDKTTG